MFGLAHCSYFHCLMNESSSVPEAERQPLFLCPVCLRKMCKALKFDIMTRYRVMLEQLRSLSAELHDTCSCGMKEARGGKVETCDPERKQRFSSKDCDCDCDCVVGLEGNHSTKEEEIREELTADCEQQVTETPRPLHGTMQEGGCSRSDCQLQHLRNATQWLKMQLDACAV